MTAAFDREAFLREYPVTREEIEQDGLGWGLLEQIHQKYRAEIPDLEDAANGIAARLRRIPEVHSLAVRVKHPERLLAKLVRKKRERPGFAVTVDTYADRVTDLVGIRALHLFKHQWEPIHDAIRETYKLRERPTANVRRGDLEEMSERFRARRLRVHEHEFGYRSVHYLVKTAPTSRVRVAEIQVRTIFEEGWAEIDHRYRYPDDTQNELLANFLRILNRLAGSADEMGTFVSALVAELETTATALHERDRKIAELHEQIGRLEGVSEAQKAELQKRVADVMEQPSVSGQSLVSGSFLRHVATLLPPHEERHLSGLVRNLFQPVVPGESLALAQLRRLHDADAPVRAAAAALGAALEPTRRAAEHIERAVAVPIIQPAAKRRISAAMKRPKDEK